MRKAVVIVAAVALVLGMAAGTHAEQQYIPHGFSYDPMFSTLSIVRNHPMVGLNILGELELPEGVPGILVSARPGDPWVVENGQIHHINLVDRSMVSVPCAQAEGLKPVGVPCGYLLPDGSQAIMALTPGDADDLDPRSRIVVFDLASKSGRVLVEGARRPALSPDGKRVAYEKLGAGSGVYVMPLAGGASTKVGSYETVWSWTADDRLAVSNVVDGKTTASYLVKPDGSEPLQLLTLAENLISPCWIVVSPSGNEIVFMDGETAFVSPLDGTEAAGFFSTPADQSVLAFQWAPLE